MLLQLSGQAVFMGILGIGIAIVLGIWFYKAIVLNSENNELDSPVTYSLRHRTKHASKNLLHDRGRAFGFGIVASLLCAVIAINWTIYEREVDLSDYYDHIDTEELEIVPRTSQEPSLPPPPPPPKVVEIIEDPLLEDEPDDLIDTSIDFDDEVLDAPPSPPVAAAITAPPPPLPEPEFDGNEIVIFVEQMPLFGGCTDKACSDAALLKFIYRHIKYPEIAKESNVEGRVYAEFVVEKDGHLSDIKILRGIGAGCDEEVLKVVHKMNEGNAKWTPGRQGSRTVRVLYKLPVTFRLN